MLRCRRTVRWTLAHLWLAERQVNSQFFGNRSPTRQECGEEVFVDGCAAPISRAMYLGDSAYPGRTQRDIYKEALGGEAWMISPRRGISP